MKIERISENQIRCTLNKEDLEDKEIRLSELAYGTEKAKELFRDMMQQASIELGFEADETPLMIEAIPVNPDCLILVITKVSDPEELDTRFSRFTKPFPNAEEDDDDDEFDDDLLDDDEIDIPFNKEQPPKGLFPSGIPGADKILQALGSIAEGLTSAAAEAVNKQRMEKADKNTTNTDSVNTTAASSKKEEKKSEAPKNVVAIFKFKSLQEIIKACRIVNKNFGGSSCLYKNEAEGDFYLIVTKDMMNDIEFLKVCSVLGEYGESYKGVYSTGAFFYEHYKCMIRDDAVEALYDISGK